MSKCPGGIPLIDFLGFQRDHVVLELLETKNDRNLGYFYAFWLFLRGFFTLTPLQPRGRAWDPGIQLEGLIPEILVPFTTR